MTKGVLWLVATLFAGMLGTLLLLAQRLPAIPGPVPKTAPLASTRPLSAPPSSVLVRPLPAYFVARGGLVERAVEEAVERVGRLSDGCRVLMTSHNDIPASWLSSPRPLSEGDVAQAADLYWSLRALGCHVHVAFIHPTSLHALLPHYSAIFTGYLGIFEFSQKPGLSSFWRNRTFLIDIYGTTVDHLQDGVMPFCCTHLPAHHVLTMFPNFAPENSFLGLIVPTPSVCQSLPHPRTKLWRAVVWAKAPSQLDIPSVLLLSRMIPVVLTMDPVAALSSTNISFVGRLAMDDFFSLIRDSIVFVASGGHFLGLAPIQAINCGTTYLQMSWKKEHAERFVRGKPTSMVPTSPVPFFEHNYLDQAKTVDFENEAALRKGLQDIWDEMPHKKRVEVKEFSADAFVKRVRDIIRPTLPAFK